MDSNSNFVKVQLQLLPPTPHSRNKPPLSFLSPSWIKNSPNSSNVHSSLTKLNLAKNYANSSQKLSHSVNKQTIVSSSLMNPLMKASFQGSTHITSSHVATEDYIAFDDQILEQAMQMGHGSVVALRPFLKEQMKHLKSDSKKFHAVATASILQQQHDMTVITSQDNTTSQNVSPWGSKASLPQYRTKVLIAGNQNLHPHSQSQEQLKIRHVSPARVKFLEQPQKSDKNYGGIGGSHIEQKEIALFQQKIQKMIKEHQGSPARSYLFKEQFGFSSPIGYSSTKNLKEGKEIKDLRIKYSQVVDSLPRRNSFNTHSNNNQINNSTLKLPSIILSNNVSNMALGDNSRNGPLRQPNFDSTSSIRAVPDTLNMASPFSRSLNAESTTNLNNDLQIHIQSTQGEQEFYEYLDYPEFPQIKNNDTLTPYNLQIPTGEETLNIDATPINNKTSFEYLRDPDVSEQMTQQQKTTDIREQENTIEVEKASQENQAAKEPSLDQEAIQALNDMLPQGRQEPLPPLSEKVEEVAEQEEQTMAIEQTSLDQDNTIQKSRVLQSGKSSARHSHKIDDSNYSDDQFEDGKYNSDDSDDIHKWENKNLLESDDQLKKYLNDFKKIEKIADRDSAYALRSNPIHEYLKVIGKEHYFPYKIPFQKDQYKKKGSQIEDEPEEQAKIGMKSVYVSKPMANAFSQNLQTNNHLTALILKRAKLTDQTFQSVFTKIPEHLKRLDISQNPNLSIKSYQSLCKQLLDMRSRITHLNLDGNKVGDHVIQELCQTICMLKTLQVLNFSKCSITDVGAFYISKLLTNGYLKIRALILHWNKIRGRGSEVLANALRQNSDLQVFDASFNAFGSSSLKKRRKKGRKPKKLTAASGIPWANQIIDQADYEEDPEKYTKSAYKWAKAFTDNKTLIHCDFSFNSFNEEDMKVMGEALKENQTILGIHLLGNEAEVDEMGFVIPCKKVDQGAHHIYSRLPQTLLTGVMKSKQKIELKVAQNCWLCQGWAQVEFKIDKAQVKAAAYPRSPSHQFDELEIVVNLHTNFDGYKPHRMEEAVENKEQVYILHRMVPPGSLSYFYSIGEFPEEMEAAKDPIDFSNIMTLTDGSKPIIFNQQQDGNAGNVNHTVINVQKVNYIEEVELLNEKLSLESLKNMKAMPRPKSYYEIQKKLLQKKQQEEMEVKVEIIKKPPTPWNVSKSVFNNFTQDTDKLYDKCFEFDWSCSRIEKMLQSQTKEHRDRVYNYLKTRYRYIKDAYKFFSALNPSGIYCSIGTNLFNYIILNCKNNLVDGRYLKMTDVGLEFITTKASGNQIKTKTNPDRQLIRYQFMEIFVRIGIHKYYKTKICPSMDEAIIKLFEHHVIPYLKQFDSQVFRMTKLYKETTDNVLRTHMQTLKDIYNKASAVDAKPNEDSLMSIGEFTKVIMTTLTNDESLNMNAREIGTLFNLSMMTQVDEIFSERHCQMTFIEFVEAICRVADRVVCPVSQLSLLQQQEQQRVPDPPKTQFNKSSSSNNLLVGESFAGKNSISPASRRNKFSIKKSTMNDGSRKANEVTGQDPEDFDAAQVVHHMSTDQNQDNPTNNIQAMTSQQSNFGVSSNKTQQKMSLEEKVHEYIWMLVSKIMGVEYANNYMKNVQLKGSFLSSQNSLPREKGNAASAIV